MQGQFAADSERAHPAGRAPGTPSMLAAVGSRRGRVASGTARRLLPP
jgi:hypothetical protein